MTNLAPAADAASAGMGRASWPLPGIPVSLQEIAAAIASEAEGMAHIAGTLREPGPEATAAEQLRRDLVGVYSSLGGVAAGARAVIEHTQASPGARYALRNLLTACQLAHRCADVLTSALEVPPMTPRATAATRTAAARPLEQACGHMLIVVGHLLPVPDTPPTGPYRS